MFFVFLYFVSCLFFVVKMNNDNEWMTGRDRLKQDIFPFPRPQGFWFLTGHTLTHTRTWQHQTLTEPFPPKNHTSYHPENFYGHSDILSFQSFVPSLLSGSTTATGLLLLRTSCLINLVLDHEKKKATTLKEKDSETEELTKQNIIQTKRRAVWNNPQTSQTLLLMLQLHLAKRNKYILWCRLKKKKFITIFS